MRKEEKKYKKAKKAKGKLKKSVAKKPERVNSQTKFHCM